VKSSEILARSAKILGLDDRERYFSDGYLSVSGLVDAGWLQRLRAVTDEFVELSRAAVRGKDARFDLEANHSAEQPRLRRLNSPVELHETYWAFASQGPFADIAEDLLGPNFKFHHSKLNFKWGGGGEAVQWHQDIQFWPHTNYDVVTLGVYLDDVGAAMAPMGVMPGSHNGPLYDLYNADDQWVGSLNEKDVGQLPLDDAVYLAGPAGTITVHNCRMLHGSAANDSERPRPLLLCAYSAADALPITNLTAGARYSEVQIRGEPARWARFDPRPCLLPPDWSKQGGYKSIFEHQLQEQSK